MKRKLFVCSIILALILVGCGNGNNSSMEDSRSDISSETVQETVTNTDEYSEASVEETAEEELAVGWDKESYSLLEGVWAKFDSFNVCTFIYFKPDGTVDIGEYRGEVYEQYILTGIEDGEEGYVVYCADSTGEMGTMEITSVDEFNLTMHLNNRVFVRVGADFEEADANYTADPKFYQSLFWSRSSGQKINSSIWSEDMKYYVARLIEKHYNSVLDAEGTYVVFEDYDAEFDLNNATFILRYQMGENEAEERIANDLPVMANAYVSPIIIDYESGIVTSSEMDCEDWQIW